MRALPMFLMVMLSFVWTSVNMHGKDEVANQKDDKIELIRKERKYIDPPKKVRGVAPEKFEYTVPHDSTRHSNYEYSLEVYLDKFIVWTTDSAATVGLIRNSDFIKKIEKDNEGTWAITVMTDDPLKGKKLRDRLKKSKGVISLENYLFDSPGFLLIPTRKLSVMLYNASDSIRLKQVAESLDMYAVPDDTVFKGCRWILHMKQKASPNRVELLHKIHNKLNPEFCNLYWDGILAIALFTYDPHVNLQWGLYNRNNLPVPAKKKYTDLDISRAWNYATGRNINICVIDFGLDVDNEDLKDNIVKCYDASTGENIITNPQFHGTACAGVACAVRNNNKGLSGVAPDANLMFARVGNPDEEPNVNFLGQFTKAINWAVASGADIISCSIGCYFCDELGKVVSNAIQTGRNGKGCVFVAASGNNGINRITTPGNVDGVMSIGAIDSLTNVSDFSNYGDALFAVAPGDHIFLLAPGNNYSFGNGTSFACPAVAGVAALVLQAFPGATVEQVRSIIAQSASIPTSVTDTLTKEYGTWNQKYGYGLVNAYEAVKLAVKSANSQKRLLELPYPDISSVK